MLLSNICSINWQANIKPTENKNNGSYLLATAVQENDYSNSVGKV